MGRHVFLLPHPDDEFAVALPMRDLRNAGVGVTVVFLTDGGFGGQNRERRERESLRVLSRLGVMAADVHFVGAAHGIPDGALHRHLERAVECVGELLVGLGDFAYLHLPAWEGGHQDHDAGHLLGLALRQWLPAAQLRQFPLYRATGASGPLFLVMAPLAANGALESRACAWRERLDHLRMCLAYRSQWRSWLGLLPLTMLHHALDGSFHNQPVDPRRILAPPHPGMPLYERRGSLSWAEFADATEGFRVRILSEGVTVEEI